VRHVSNVALVFRRSENFGIAEGINYSADGQTHVAVSRRPSALTRTLRISREDHVAQVSLFSFRLKKSRFRSAYSRCGVIRMSTSPVHDLGGCRGQTMIAIVAAFVETGIVTSVTRPSRNRTGPTTNAWGRFRVLSPTLMVETESHVVAREGDVVPGYRRNVIGMR